MLVHQIALLIENVLHCINTFLFQKYLANRFKYFEYNGHFPFVQKTGSAIFPGIYSYIVDVNALTYISDREVVVCSLKY